MSDSQALSILLKAPVSQEMIHHLVVATLQVLPCAHDNRYPSPPSSPDAKESADAQHLPSLMTFITKLVRYTNVYTGTLMATLVYLNRLRSKLPKDAQGLPCTRHRIFLACLILSSKYHNDSSPKNKHWAKYTDSLFDKKDVNLMERQLLYLLDWDLRIEEEELCKSLKRFIQPIKQDLKKASKIRRSLQKQQQRQKQVLQQAAAQQRYLNTHSAAPLQRSPLQPLQLLTPTPSPSNSPVRSTSLESLHSRASSTCSVRTLNSDTEESMALRVQLQSQQPQRPHYSLSETKTAALNEERELNDLLRRYEMTF